jgi:hypothetical protein
MIIFVGMMIVNVNSIINGIEMHNSTHCNSFGIVGYYEHTGCGYPDQAVGDKKQQQNGKK